MKTKIFLVLLVAGALCAVQPALAHHAFAAQYDPTKPLTLNGIVTRMEWANPHGWIFMDTKEPDGKVKHWTIETAAPSQLSRHGLKKADFTDGMSAVVKGYQGKNDPALANGRTLVLKDGRSFYIGSVGGPNDGAEPQ
jgi:Family of unknown function (DUF6152)